MDWNTLANLTIAVTGIGTLVIGYSMMNKKGKADVTLKPQPVKVEITEELHEQFADKASFEKHCAGNATRHSEIFHRIDAVQQAAAAARDALANEMRAADNAIKESLNEKFSSIQRLLGRIEQKIDSK